MRTLLPRLAASVLALAACADQAPLAPTTPDATARTTSLPVSAPWARAVTGETGPGSLYAIYVPDDWNGDVVYFVHGILPPSAPVTLPDDPTDWDGFTTVRDQLGALGFAVAYSSFSQNGFAIKDAAQRTHQLRGLVASTLHGQPDRSFLVGYSLGAAAALRLVEQFPVQYDGALLACGMVGGTPLELQYVGHVRALFDFFYPGVLPGDVVNVPEGAALTPQLQAQVLAAIAANPAGLFAIASTVQTPLAYAPVGSLADPSSPAFTTLVQSLLTALGYQLVGTNDVMDHTHGHSPFDNSETAYAVGTVVGPLPAPVVTQLVAAANAGVVRYTMPPDARNALEHYYVPTGELEIPVITVHNLWDPLVPFFHEAAFQQVVQEAGAAGMLLQRSVPQYGHCSNLPVPLLLQSLQDLVGWATTGVKPAG